MQLARSKALGMRRDSANQCDFSGDAVCKQNGRNGAYVTYRQGTTNSSGHALWRTSAGLSCWVKFRAVLMRPRWENACGKLPI